MLHESISLPVAATLLLVVGLCWGFGGWLLAGVVTHQSPYAEFHRCRPSTSLPSLPRILPAHQISRDIIYQILAQLEFYLQFRISPVDRFVEGYFIPRVHLRPLLQSRLLGMSFKNYPSVTRSGQKSPSIFGGFLWIHSRFQLYEFPRT